MQFVMKGKIISTKFHNGKHYTIVVTPAVDIYSQPSSFRVQSDSPLGADNQEVNLLISVSGYVKNENYRDKTTGQMMSIDKPNVYLNASLYAGKQQAGQAA